MLRIIFEWIIIMIYIMNNLSKLLKLCNTIVWSSESIAMSIGTDLIFTTRHMYLLFLNRYTYNQWSLVLFFYFSIKMIILPATRIFLIITLYFSNERKRGVMRRRESNCLHRFAQSMVSCLRTWRAFIYTNRSSASNKILLWIPRERFDTFNRGTEIYRRNRSTCKKTHEKNQTLIIPHL